MSFFYLNKVVFLEEFLEMKNLQVVKMKNIVFIFPNDPEYNLVRFGQNSRFDIHPRVIARPVNTCGVRELLKFIRETGEEFAIRSGGHCLLTL